MEFMALTNAERQAKFRAQRPAPVRVYVKPKTKQQSRPARWQHAVNELRAMLDDYQAWRESLPDNLTDSALAEKLDAMEELTELVDQLEEADLPRGFGRD